MKKIAVFADVQNIYYTTREVYQRQFNYRQLWSNITEQGEICQAFAYATSRQDDQQHKFQNALKHIGFQVKLKPYIQRSDGSAKGDWDVGITVDIMEFSDSVDTVILLSGDGDFDIVMETVKRKFGVSTEVYGVPGLTAASLVHAVDIFHGIDERLLLG